MTVLGGDNLYNAAVWSFYLAAATALVIYFLDKKNLFSSAASFFKIFGLMWLSIAIVVLGLIVLRQGKETAQPVEQTQTGNSPR